jgi:hypothetical protein
MDSVDTFIADFLCLTPDIYLMEIFDVAFLTADTTKIRVITWIRLASRTTPFIA